MSNASSQSTREIIERFYSCAENGQIKAALALLDNEFEMEQPPYLPYGGRHRGASGLMTVFRGVAGWMAPASARLEFLLVEGGRAVASACSTVAATGAEVIATESWTVRDGKIRHCRVSFFDPEPILAALSSG
jgi:ketosteroid isomerase-like protein